MLAVVDLAAVYFFNVVNKSGAIWKRGETVHYVLHLDRMVTGIAVFFREHLPLWAMKGATWSVLCLEALLVAWILAPAGRRIVRLLALLGIWSLHTTFGVMMRLGPFSWFLIAWSFLLVVPEHWDALENWYRRRASPRTVVYDASSPLAFAICRALRRLDRLELLQFEPGDGSPELVVARDPGDGRTFMGLAGAREIAQALPGGRLLFPVFRVATLGMAGNVLALMARHRETIARFFGLEPRPRGREERRGESPLAVRLARIRGGAREVVIGFLAVCAVSQAINENKSIPAELNFRIFKIPIKHKQPKVMEAVIGYPRMYQGWGMFAPNPIQDDGTLAVDAITLDGRHVDPFTGKLPDLDLTDARGLGLNQIWQDYFNRIRFDRNKAFRQGLRDYLVEWHVETGHPEDELVAFDVYWVRDQCPRPGQRDPSKNETIAILTYRKPGYTPPPGQQPLPPEPKVESAGN
jgi:hypothetical protein